MISYGQLAKSFAKLFAGRCRVLLNVQKAALGCQPICAQTSRTDAFDKKTPLSRNGRREGAFVG